MVLEKRETLKDVWFLKELPDVFLPHHVPPVSLSRRNLGVAERGKNTTGLGASPSHRQADDNTSST